MGFLLGGDGCTCQLLSGHLHVKQRRGFLCTCTPVAVRVRYSLYNVHDVATRMERYKHNKLLASVVRGSSGDPPPVHKVESQGSSHEDMVLRSRGRFAHPKSILNPLYYKQKSFVLSKAMRIRATPDSLNLNTEDLKTVLSTFTESANCHVEVHW